MFCDIYSCKHYKDIDLIFGSLLAKAQDGHFHKPGGYEEFQKAIAFSVFTYEETGKKLGPMKNCAIETFLQQQVRDARWFLIPFILTD